MIERIYQLLNELLDRMVDTQSRAARIETRLMKLADALEIEVKK